MDNISYGLEDISNALEQISSHYISTNTNLAGEPIAKVADAATTTSLSQKYATPDDKPHRIEDVMKEAFEVSDYRVRMNHPCFFGFIPSPVLPLAWLGDVVSTTFNAHGGSRLQSSGPSAIEHGLIHWLACRAGLPAATAGGLAVSGGSMANLTAMAMARDHNLPRAQWHLGTVYVSDQTHSSLAKGLRILGFHEDQVRMVPTDGHFRMDTSALEAMTSKDRDAGRCPFLVVATCGTTNTGAIDPIEEIVRIGRAEKMWVHVDGAYGATALLSNSDSLESLAGAMGGVDSISWDAHKWLFQTYGCGFLLVRDQSLLGKSFRTGAEYTQDALDLDDIPNYWNLGVELTRPTRAMKLWFTLRVLGVEQISSLIDHGIAMAEFAEQRIRQLRNWEIVSPASLAIVTFRFVPPGMTEEELDVLNREISAHLLTENVAGMLTTKVNGKVVLRICSISPSLTREVLESVIAEMDTTARIKMGK
ncbi:hypothetical protein FE257_000196 [Aspergillus nanangensis]|uniref:Uncharacterized protein n=1 Tax=Aspergillus nanangensis TaxID=2582783 RepID=A0AAD4D0X7_ASPNN|nr:hypothetical protein FE257_000196 [Aspergillus nanangensis]